MIQDNQYASVKGMYILDGITIANGVVDEVKKSNKKFILFKVDFEKA